MVSKKDVREIDSLPVLEEVTLEVDDQRVDLKKYAMYDNLIFGCFWICDNSL